MASFRELTKRWQGKLEISRKRKEREFSKFAKIAMRFYSGPHNFIYDGRDLADSGVNAANNLGDPEFKMTLNKVAELVQVLLPSLYHRNPHRTVTARQQAIDLAQFGLPPSPVRQEDLLRASLLSWYLNWTPNEFGYSEEAKLAVVETIIKGAGVNWAELEPQPDGSVIPVIRYDSIDNFFIDGDHDRIKNAKWIARKRCEPKWEVERRFGLEPGTLQGREASYSSAADNRPDRPNDKYPDGTTTDLITYYDVYSRMGAGGRLSGVDPDDREMFDLLGDHIYLAIADGMDYPLNLPKEIFQGEDALDQIAERTRWPFSTFLDRTNPWPCAVLSFWSIPGQLWPMAHITPALGEQMLLDFLASFMAGQAYAGSRQFIAVAPEASQQVRETIRNGKHLSMLELDPTTNTPIHELVQFLNHPQVNNDLWQIKADAERAFESRTGLTELMVGGQMRTQPRTAMEIQEKKSASMTRPDEMASCVEEWQARLARLEAICAAEYVSPEMFAKLVGEKPQQVMGSDAFGQPVPMGMQEGPMAQLWRSLVSERPLEEVLSEVQYRIESGSTRRPNKDRDIGNIDETAHIVLPQLTQAYSLSGDPTAVNAWLAKWAETRDFDMENLWVPDLRQMMMQQMMQQQQAQMQPQQQMVG